MKTVSSYSGFVSISDKVKALADSKYTHTGINKQLVKGKWI